MGWGQEDRIYVKDYSQYTAAVSLSTEERRADNTTDVRNSDNSTDIRKSDVYNNNNIDDNIIPLPNSSGFDLHDDDLSKSVRQSNIQKTDRQNDRIISQEERNLIQEAIRKNISYDFVETQLFGDGSEFNFTGIKASDWDLFQTIYLIMCDTLTGSREPIRIGRSEMAYEYVKEKFLNLRLQEIAFVIHKFSEAAQKTEIGNKRTYLLRCLINAKADAVAASYK